MMTQTLRRAPAAQRVVLHHIAWPTFKALLHDARADHHIRFAYYQGTLEIMSPLYRHENVNRFIDDLIRIMTDEMGMDMCKGGSMRLIRDDVEAGAEPDSCYYIQSESLVRGLEFIDLNAGDPPPDLVIEVDMSSNSLDKLGLYAALGVREFWRFAGSTVQFFVLDECQGCYLPVVKSPLFPLFYAEKLGDLLSERLAIGETQTLRQFRRWVGEVIAG